MKDIFQDYPVEPFPFFSLVRILMFSVLITLILLLGYVSFFAKDSQNEVSQPLESPTTELIQETDKNDK